MQPTPAPTIQTAPDRTRPVTAPALPRLPTVDLLRGLSILAVVLLHAWLRFRLEDVRVGTGLPRFWRHLLFANGGNGVTVFFAVSGFLITLTAIRRFSGLSQLRAGTFYRIRFARIAPLLGLVLLVLSALHLLSLQYPAFEAWHVKASVGLGRALFAAATFHLNWLEAKTGYLPANWDVMWSLSVEEVFYLTFPLVVIGLLGRRSPLRRIGPVLFGLMAAALLVLGPWARSVWLSSSEIAQEKSYLGGMNAIALGCLAALLADRLLRQAQPRWRGWWYAAEALGWTLVLWMACWPTWQWLHGTNRFLARHDLDDTVLPLGVCLVTVSALLRGARGGGALCAPLRWLGRHSYEVYLTHEFVIIVAVELYLRWHGRHPAIWTAGVVLLSAALGWAVARGFSEPLNRRLRGAQPAPGLTWGLPVGAGQA